MINSYEAPITDLIGHEISGFHQVEGKLVLFLTSGVIYEYTPTCQWGRFLLVSREEVLKAMTKLAQYLEMIQAFTWDDEEGQAIWEDLVEFYGRHDPWLTDLSIRVRLAEWRRKDELERTVCKNGIK